MCGIAGTVYNHNFFNGSEVRPEELSDLLNSFKNEYINSDQLLDLSWKYKSNCNFIRYRKSKKEKAEISKFVSEISNLINKKRNELPTIDKTIFNKRYKTTKNDYSNLQDVSWFLKDEIEKQINTIGQLTEKKIEDLEDRALIFYREISKVIHAIDNRLELRGRDSFGISIMINYNNIADIDHTKYSSINNSAINYSCNIEQGVYEFTFKTCDAIGSLGDNATQIKNLIKNDKYFSKIIHSNKIEKATIVHTRWASVGEVSLENAHPISFQHENNNTNKIFSMSSLNGDIYNHRDIIIIQKEQQKKI